MKSTPASLSLKSDSSELTVLNDGQLVLHSAGPIATAADVVVSCIGGPFPLSPFPQQVGQIRALRGSVSYKVGSSTRVLEEGKSAPITGESPAIIVGKANGGFVQALLTFQKKAPVARPKTRGSSVGNGSEENN